MERNKSSKESQSQYLKEVLAEFDIETHVNKIAVRCFTDLLSSNKQAFDIIAESQRKITDFQTRLCKTEGFTESIEKNVSSKIEIANNLNRRLETFSTEFYASLKENESLMQNMRKDYDSLVTTTQKNTYELRSISDMLKKNAQTMLDMDKKVEIEISTFTFKVNEGQLQTEKQFAQVRAECEALRNSLTQARTYFLSQSGNFEQISKDMALYKHEKDTINRRIIDLMNEVELKMNKSDFNQFRLLLDSRLVTEHEHHSHLISDLKNMLKQQKNQRKEDVKNITSDSSTRWKQQQANNLSVHNRLTELKDEIMLNIEKLNSKHDNYEAFIKKELEAMSKKQSGDFTWTKVELKKAGDQIEQNLAKISDCEKFMQARYEESIETNSTLNALSDRLDQMIRENNERRKELTRIEASQNQNQIGESVNSLNDVIGHIQEQIYEFNKTLITLAKDITQSKRNSDEVHSQLQEQKKSILNVISNQKLENQARVTQLNRHINNVSIEIMNNLHASETESKRYTDGLIQAIKDKLQFLDRVNQQIQDLQQAFEEQMKETKAVNLSITQKMQKSNANMTKFKSDLSLRVDSIVNEQQRRSLETKEISKLVDDSRKHLGYLTEGLFISLAILIHREFIEDNEGVKEIKISSLLEGWVLEIDEKQVKYRGQHLQRRKLVAAYLNFLVFNSDKIKGSLIESGKDVYARMIEESQEIFTARKKGLSKKLGSELPKLHL